jgi:hypothetical protein
MKLLQKLEDFIFNSPRGRLIKCLISIMILKTGIWVIPNIAMTRIIARNPFINPFQYNPNAHYLLYSWLLPFLAWVLRSYNKYTFFIFSLCFSIGFTILFIKTIFKKLPEREARIALVLFFLLPVSATSYYWVSNDSLTLFLMILLFVYPKKNLFNFFIAILIGLQHFEVGFFAAGAILFAFLIDYYYKLDDNKDAEFTIKWGLIIFLGVIFGKIILMLIFNYFNIQINSGRIYWWLNHSKQLLIDFVFNLHFVIWSVLNVGWFIFFKYVEKGKKSFSFIIPFLGLVMILSAIASDQTRIVAMATFLLVMIYWFLNLDFLKKIDKRTISILFLLWLIVPWGWAWGGKGRNGVIVYDIVYIAKKVLNINIKNVDFYIWPF